MIIISVKPKSRKRNARDRVPDPDDLVVDREDVLSNEAQFLVMRMLRGVTVRDGVEGPGVIQH